MLWAFKSAPMSIWALLQTEHFSGILFGDLHDVVVVLVVDHEFKVNARPCVKGMYF